MDFQTTQNFGVLSHFISKNLGQQKSDPIVHAAEETLEEQLETLEEQLFQNHVIILIAILQNNIYVVFVRKYFFDLSGFIRSHCMGTLIRFPWLLYRSRVTFNSLLYFMHFAELMMPIILR